MPAAGSTPPAPKYQWQVTASRAVKQEDGSVRLECTVRRNGTDVGTLVFLGAAGIEKPSDLMPWWLPQDGDR